MPITLEPEGLVGRVTDATLRAVGGGTVYLVPTADVIALAAVPIDLTLAPAAAAALGTDEPIEDVIDARGATLTQAAVGSDGVYRFVSIPTGSYFVVWVPSASDAAHLPGGDRCRVALDRGSLVGTQLDLRVSGRASLEATHVGSSTCMVCHGRHRTMRTAHRVGIGVPGVRGNLQDTSPWPRFDEALVAFERGDSLYYSDCDGTRTGISKCTVGDVDPRVASPGVSVSLIVHLGHDATRARGTPGEYFVVLENGRGSGSVRYDVVLTYGGAVFRQLFLTRRRNAGGSLGYFLLPMQYQFGGDVGSASPDDRVWRDYRSDDWYDHTAGALRDPGNVASFDNNCAGCHLTGFSLGGSASTGWIARAVADVNGELDYDGDGRRDEIDVGCESCHGPGSEHLEASVRGSRIVSPSLLTPERETTLCGRCHSRPAGVGGGATEAPLSMDGLMPWAGIRRAEVARSFVTRVDADATHLFASGDSRSHHQQYTDFLRSSMYRNGSVLMTCTSCHDAHGSTQAHELRAPATDNGACTTCHSADAYIHPRDHLFAATGNRHDGLEEAQIHCVDCHMARTATSGAHRPGLVDAFPAGAPVVRYLQGDLASHRFTVTRRAEAALQPIAATNACAVCHTTYLPNP